jgi:hypothetical protein
MPAAATKMNMHFLKRANVILGVGRVEQTGKASFYFIMFDGKLGVALPPP